MTKVFVTKRYHFLFVEMQKNILVEDLGSQLTSFFTDECLPDSSEYPFPLSFPFCIDFQYHRLFS